MNWLAMILFPRTERHDARRQLNLILGVIVFGGVVAAIVGVCFYLTNGRAWHKGP